ncbi:MAG: IPT/TIG domain-containing protein, partial [Planctomycetota bacterium]|nr:IPT/TIG domain-containing protein [Planctomycetota bacterium]
MRASNLALVSVLAFAACSSSGGGESAPPPEPNDPPTLSAPAGLGGGPVQFNFLLPIAGAESLTFTATDPDGDVLSWQVAASAAGQAAAGLSFSAPASGPTFTIDVAPVGAPAAAPLSLLVEDPNGGAAAIDILFVRSGPPAITAVSPSSAFASAPQQAIITGSALLLENAVNTTAAFGASAASNVVVVDDNTITCATPSPGLLGANSVSVQNAFGSDALTSGAFTMYQHPLDLFAADVTLDAGGGEQLVVASEGPTIHAAYLEAGTLVHQRSLDAGATWSAAQPLTSGEVASEVQLSLLGDELVVSWIGDGATVRARASSDGGVVFDAAVTLNVVGDPVSRPRLARAGARVYCAWLQGFAGLNEQLVHLTVSPNNGGVWQPAAAISDQGVNHEGHVIGADDNAAWVAFESAPSSGAGVYTSRSDDGGFLWTAGVLRSAVSNGIGELA